MSEFYVESALAALAGVLMIALGVLGARERLPRNEWVGIRVPATMRSEAAWRAAHAAGAGWCILAGASCLAGVAVAVTGSRTRWTESTASMIVVWSLVLLTVLVLVAAAVGIRAANRVSDDRPR